MSHLRMAQNEQSQQKTGQFQIQKRPVVSKTVPQIKGRQNLCHAWNLGDLPHVGRNSTW